SRALGLHRLRLVLDFGLFLGCNHVSLRPLVQSSALGLVLVAGSSVGAFMGDLALGWRLLRVGAAASVCVLSAGNWIFVSRTISWIQLRLRDWSQLVHVRSVFTP